MDRRDYLKASLGGMGIALALPTAGSALAGSMTGQSLAGGTDSVHSLAGQTMGTSYSVKYVGPANGALESAIGNSLSDTDARMTTYQNSSELMQLNVAATGEWQPLSAESFKVMAAADAMREQSNGAFDPSVGALVNLWGFGAAGAMSSQPLARDISAEMAGIGGFEVDADTRSARRLHEAAALDLSGIAKGYGADRVAELLESQGITHYLVEVGGELRGRGRKPGNAPWRVAIERPDSAKRSIFRVLDLNDSAIATSGDYRNFFIDGGERFSHTIDPRTGRPVNHELASVSVIAPTTLEADAWSTTLMVLGPQGAYDLATKHGIAAQFILKSGNALEESWTPAFEPFIGA